MSDEKRDLLAKSLARSLGGGAATEHLMANLVEMFDEMCQAAGIELGFRIHKEPHP